MLEVTNLKSSIELNKKQTEKVIGGGAVPGGITGAFGGGTAGYVYGIGKGIWDGKDFLGVLESGTEKAIEGFVTGGVGGFIGGGIATAPAGGAALKN